VWAKDHGSTSDSRGSGARTSRGGGTRIAQENHIMPALVRAALESLVPPLEAAFGRGSQPPLALLLAGILALALVRCSRRR
jgi:hypothetical protein